MTGDVAGQQVGRELDPVVLASAQNCQCPGQSGLAQSWHAFNQQVTAGNQGCHRADKGFLPRKHRCRETFFQPAGQGLRPAQTLFLFCHSLLLFLRFGGKTKRLRPVRRKVAKEA